MITISRKLAIRSKSFVRVPAAAICCSDKWSRSFHSSHSFWGPAADKARAKQKNATRDTRLAGRLRFYKQVGVASVEAPWQDTSLDTLVSVDSPISAGVDGTQSASGVENTIRVSASKRRERLIPRKPGCSNIKDEHAVDWFGVTLDGRLVKTPMGQTLAVPSKLLAWAIAAEWDSQERHLQPAQMPLMTLACTALDQTASAPEQVQKHSLRYLPTDTICYWADPTEDRVLHRRQQQAWDDIHKHCEAMFGGRPALAMGANEGLVMSRVRSQKSIGLPHPDDLVSCAHDFVHLLDAWHLTALSSVASEAKSFLVGMALLSGGTQPDAAVEAARVEEEFQISNWGLVEGGHDYDRLNCSIQIRAAHLLVSSIAIDNDM
jgi:ATP synthase F1 complex assembly factor 2